MRSSKILALVVALWLWPSVTMANPTPPVTPTPVPTTGATPASPATPAPSPASVAPPAPVSSAPTSAGSVAPSEASTRPAPLPSASAQASTDASPAAEATESAPASAAKVAGRKVKQRASTSMVFLPLTAAEGQGTAGEKPLRAKLPPTAGDTFTMVAVTWTDSGAGSHPEVTLRTRSKATWSAWLSLEEEEATGGSRKGTSAVYVGPADGIEVRIATDPGAPAPVDPQVILIAPTELAADSTLAPLPPGGQQRGRVLTGPQVPAVLTAPNALQPSIVSRASWGAGSDTGCAGPDATVRAVVMHHTEGTNDYTAAQSAGIVRGIQSYHIDGRGWCDIGYNFLVDKYGVIFEGRVGGINVPVHGAHAFEWNTTTAGISLMGSYMTALPPEVQLQAAVSLVAWKLSSYYRAPYGQLTIGGITADVISGHRQASSTDCPGQAFYDYLPTFRQRVATAMGTTQSSIQQRWLAMGGASSWVGEPYAGETGTAGGRVTVFAGADIYANASATFAVSGEIRDRYRALGGSTWYMGFPTGEVGCYQVAGGCIQEFAGGTMFWSPTTKAWDVTGDIRARYLAIGGPSSPLGYPTGGVTCGQREGGCSQPYQNGIMEWTPAGGAWEVWGAIASGYAANGREDGALGYPVGSAVCSQPGGGCLQRFAGGVVVATPTSARGFMSTGPIATYYEANGFAGGRLGYPVGDISCSATGCRQSFENGTLTSDPAGTVTFAVTSDADIFINAIAGMAQQSQATHRVPASVTIAQAILESGWGRSFLPTYAQNYFGIKCKATMSPYQQGCMDKASLEYYDPANPVSEVSSFRSYASVADSFVDHGYFLATNSRYAAAFSTTNADDFIRAVAAAGYATDPTYPTMIISIMQRYNLYRFDSGAVPATTAVSGAIGTAYANVGGPTGALGPRVTAEADGPVANSRYVSFNKGMIATSSAYGAHAISGLVWDSYRRIGDTRTELAQVASDPYAKAGVTVQDFAGGRFYVVGGSAFPVSGEFWSRYVATGAEAGYLGLPTGPRRCGLAAGGCTQPFQGGALWWSPGTGVWDTSGDIHARYVDIGGPASWEGYPTGPVQCGLVAAGCTQAYQGGALWWTPSTKAWDTSGDIHARFTADGGPSSALGYPTGRVVCGLIGGGCQQLFTGGTMWWTSATKAWPTTGSIHTRYVGIGGPSSWEGYPTGSPDCTLPSGACTQPFQGGAIWSSTTTGAWDTSGDIHARYLAMGGARSALGLPTGKVTCGLAPSGCVQPYERGAMYWSPSTGAWESTGPLRTRYLQIGAQASWEGYPTGPVTCDAAGSSCTQKYQGGALWWTPATGAWDTSGDIHARYVAIGGPASWEGYPTGPVQCGLTGGGCSQSFQGGVLWWTPATKAWDTSGDIHAKYLSVGAQNSPLAYPAGPVQCRDGGCTQRYQGGTMQWTPTLGAWF